MSKEEPETQMNVVTPLQFTTNFSANDIAWHLTYNKSMLLRIQRSQIQDIPVQQFAKRVALQQGVLRLHHRRCAESTQRGSGMARGSS